MPPENAPLAEDASSSKPDTSTNSTDVGAQAKARRARERQLERKRARGEASCAECRRLKLKCNKKVPCSSCIRRGCHTICPNGSLASGQGTRFVLANTDKLHSKLLDMSKRIRQLEDALHIAQSSISPAPHPLLSEELLSIKSGVDILYEGKGEPEEEEEDPEMAAAFGTLTISERGDARFVGRVGAEALLLSGFDEAMEPTTCKASENRCTLPEEIAHISKSFPFAPAYLPKDEILALIEARLPSYERATALTEAYLENIAWFFRPIQREQIVEDLIPLLYKRRGGASFASENANGSLTNGAGICGTHHLALALMVFACGAAGDLTLPPHNPEAELYKHLARAALSLQPVFGGASLETVQAIVLLSAYDFFTCKITTLESLWKMMSLGLVLAAGIGLHRDPAPWNLDPKLTQRRRSVFWEIYAVDKWKSLGTGRPAIFHAQEVDCEYPEDEDPTIAEDGTKVLGYYSWKHRFSKEVIAPISEQLCLVRPIKYSKIMELDRKIRDFENHPLVIEPLAGGIKIMNMQRYTWGLFKEIAFLFLHRNFFARALLENPSNVAQSPFAPSFFSAYASSIKLLRTMRAAFDTNPQVILRQWPIWTHTLTAGVIVGTVAVRSRPTTLASAALKELNLAIDLFERAIAHPVAKSGLPILRRIREKAHHALQNAYFPEDELSKLPPMPTEVEEKGVDGDENEELSILGGAARVVRTTNRNGKTCANVGTHVQKNSNGRSSDSYSSATSPSQAAQVEVAALRFLSASLRQHDTVGTGTMLPTNSGPTSSSTKAADRLTGTSDTSSGMSAWLSSPQSFDAQLPPDKFDFASIQGFDTGADFSSFGASHLFNGTATHASANGVSYRVPDVQEHSADVNGNTWIGFGYESALDNLVSESARAHTSGGTQGSGAVEDLFGLDEGHPARAQSYLDSAMSGMSSSSVPSGDERYNFGISEFDGFGSCEEMDVGDGDDFLAAWRSIVGGTHFTGSGMSADMLL